MRNKKINFQLCCLTMVARMIKKTSAIVKSSHIRYVYSDREYWCRLTRKNCGNGPESKLRPLSHIAGPGGMSLMSVQYHTFVEINQEIFSMFILLPLIQLQAKVCARSTG